MRSSAGMRRENAGMHASTRRGWLPGHPVGMRLPNSLHRDVEDAVPYGCVPNRDINLLAQHTTADQSRGSFSMMIPAREPRRSPAARWDQ